MPRIYMDYQATTPLDPRVLDALLRLNPLRIVYVSCHPATLARDVKHLSSKYKPTSITPVDLFPQTSHIETVCRLERLTK